MHSPKSHIVRCVCKHLSIVLVLLVLAASLMRPAMPVMASDLLELEPRPDGAFQETPDTARAAAWDHRSFAVRGNLSTEGIRRMRPGAGHFLNRAALAPGDPWWGVQMYWSYFDATLAEQLRAGWVRVPLEWEWIELANTTPENYRWPAGFEKELAQLAAMDVKVVLTLMRNPPWAATYGAGPIDKVDIAELVEFMQAAVARYSQPPYNIKHWEIYNEPDNSLRSRAESGGWGYFGHQPEKYVQVLQTLYQPIKQADPDAQIVFGGLAYDNWNQGFVQDFLDKVLAGGGGAYFDVMNFHYFNYFQSVWDPYGVDIIGKTTYIRDKLQSFGVTKPMFCTEACKGSNPGFGTEELQARYVAQLYARSKEADLDLTIWWGLYDSSVLAMQCGLLTASGTPKPAYYAYQTLAEEMIGTEYVRALPASDTGSDQIEAYQFARVDDDSPVIVVWTNDDQNHALTLEADRVVVVDKVGNTSVVDDGDDGTVDGWVRVIARPSPVYLWYQQRYRLSLDLSGQGSVDRLPDLESYPFGTTVALTPRPAPGWVFADWSGPNAGELVDQGDGSWTLTMDTDKALTAAFTTPYTLSVTVAIVGEGSVSNMPGNPYGHGQTATLQPIPANGWTFAGWTGADAGDLVDNGDGTWSLLMNGDKSVTATFEQLLYRVSLAVLGQGTVSHTPGNPYVFGQVATLRPVPNSGWSFSRWSGDHASDLVGNEDGSWSLTMDGDKWVTARFIDDQVLVTLSVSVQGNGSVLDKPGGPYALGEVATLTPIPDLGWQFSEWFGDDAADLVDHQDGTWSLTMDANKVLGCRFKQRQFEVTISTIGLGTVSMTPENPYSYGGVATLRPLAAFGWHFDGWSGPAAPELVGNGDGNWSLVVDGNKSLTARFAFNGAFLPLIEREAGR